MPVVSFSDDDLRLLRNLIRRERLRPRNRGTGPTPEDLPPQSPECYVAKIGQDGVSAFTEDDPVDGSFYPGSGFGYLYLAVENDEDDMELVSLPAATRVTVYNFGPKIIPYSWALITRDKFGRWWVADSRPYNCIHGKLVAGDGALAAGNTQFNIDHVTAMVGQSPLSDPTSTTESVSGVKSITGLPANAEAEVVAWYDYTAEVWRGITYIKTSPCT